MYVTGTATAGLAKLYENPRREKMDFTYNITDLIAKKRDGDELSEEEIRHFVNSVTLQTSSDSQIGAMLMAIFLKGMNREETVNLTKAMLKSGSTLQWPEEWKGNVADKHSTGGVGDKVSLVLAPALAVCGVKVPMISGRSLGHTGGTLDKLESIPGFRVNLSPQEMHDVLADVGCCIVGQTETLVPADRALYAIRDVTGTIASFPLITSSILSKKASEDISALVLDVKCGKAAFLTTEEKAQALAHSLVSTCYGLGIKAAALITSMNTPLGRAVGNSVEVVESIHCLSGEGPEDLKELVCEEGGLLLHMLNKAESKEAGKKLIADSLKNGKALEKFREMIVKQGVSDANAKILSTPGADHYSVLQLAPQNTDLVAHQSGIVSSIDALTFGKVCHELGAGRHQTTDSVDHGVGLVLNVQIGQFVTKGHKWLTVHHNGNLTNAQSTSLESALIINESGDTENLPVQSRVIDIIDGKQNLIFVCQ